jgi:hypothetical protein
MCTPDCFLFSVLRVSRKLGNWNIVKTQFPAQTRHIHKLWYTKIGTEQESAHSMSI